MYLNIQKKVLNDDFKKRIKLINLIKLIKIIYL